MHPFPFPRPCLLSIACCSPRTPCASSLPPPSTTFGPQQRTSHQNPKDERSRRELTPVLRAPEGYYRYPRRITQEIYPRGITQETKLRI